MNESVPLEITVADHARILQEHGKRINDCESANTLFSEYKATLDETIGAMRTTVDALEKNDKTQQELIELFKLMIKLCGWMGTAARWIGSVGAAFGVCYAIFKD